MDHLFIIFLVFYSCVAAARHHIPIPEKTTFLSVEGTDDPSSLLSSWNSTDRCKWLGVTCDFQGHVSSVNISGFNLTGILPPQIANLTSLKYLDLSKNNLHGPIPDFISDLPELEVLQLSENSFTGRIPQTLGKSGNILFLDLGSNKLNGTLPESLFFGNYFENKLQKLLLTNNNLSGSIPYIGRLHHLSMLDLSRNYFTGSIPIEIGDMMALNYLNLSRNQLGGEIPDSILRIHDLTSFDVSYNNLSGLVPFLRFNFTSFIGNQNLCGYATACRKAPRRNSIPVIFGVLGVCVVIWLLYVKMLYRVGYSRMAASASEWKIKHFHCYYNLTCEDVLTCLRDNDNIIGRGSSGPVYVGRMAFHKRQIVVKRLAEQFRDYRYPELIESLTSIKSQHIVRLLGTCTNLETVYLVYDYMPGGSLGDCLHRSQGGGVLPWGIRHKIAVQAAKGLCYLHDDFSPANIHGSIKSNNILLDANRNAYLIDFGFFRMVVNPTADGYKAPEFETYSSDRRTYLAHGVDEKIDVYSFGVVLLELITGKPPGRLDLVEWVIKMTGGEKEKVTLILDTRLLTPPPPLNEVVHVFHVAMLCVKETPCERPTMCSVVEMLEDESPSPSGLASV